VFDWWNILAKVRVAGSSPVARSKEEAEVRVSATLKNCHLATVQF
jgi:hypothetical protein